MEIRELLKELVEIMQSNANDEALNAIMFKHSDKKVLEHYRRANDQLVQEYIEHINRECELQGKAPIFPTKNN